MPRNSYYTKDGRLSVPVGDWMLFRDQLKNEILSLNISPSTFSALATKHTGYGMNVTSIAQALGTRHEFYVGDLAMVLKDLGYLQLADKILTIMNDPNEINIGNFFNYRSGIQDQLEVMIVNTWQKVYAEYNARYPSRFTTSKLGEILAYHTTPMG